ncbi:MAG: sugar phosphate isomerase/epimerase [Lentisphaeria bacterium]|nr:sugar phosphate isomerase/epimerase [Lentisphaeria bacterium]
MRDFKWGFSTLGCPANSLAESAALADEFGFRYLELRAVDDSINLPLVFSDPEKRALLMELAGEGRIRVFGSSFGFASRKNDYDELEALGRLADGAGVPYLRVFGGFSFEEEFDGEKAGIARRNLEWFRSLGLKAQLALETHDGFSSAARCRRLFEQLGETLPVIWDAHHTCRYAGEAFADSWALLAGHVVDIHVKDSKLDADGKLVATVPGEGDLAVPQLLELLEEADYTGLVTLEYEKLWHPYLPELRVALEAVNRVWR